MWHFHFPQALQPLLELPQVQYWEQRQLGKDDRHVKVDRYAKIEAQSVVTCWVEFRYFMDSKDAVTSFRHQEYYLGGVAGTQSDMKRFGIAPPKEYLRQPS
jgi:hypothetical protein